MSHCRKRNNAVDGNRKSFKPVSLEQTRSNNFSNGRVGSSWTKEGGFLSQCRFMTYTRASCPRAIKALAVSYIRRSHPEPTFAGNDVKKATLSRLAVVNFLSSLEDLNYRYDSHISYLVLS